MSTNPDPGRHSLLATIGLVAVPVLCCGLPVLIAAGGLGVLGSVLASPWVVGTAALIALGLITWVLSRRPDGSGEACCPPEPLSRNDSTDIAE